ESPPVQNEGCEPTWVSYSDCCYRILHHSGSVPAKSWEDARAYCQVLGGDLASIGTQEEGRFLQRQLMPSYGTTVFWLGLYRNSSGEIANEGWVWMDGTALKYKKWGVTTPTITTPNVTTAKPEVVCDLGWKPFRKSCYKTSDVKRQWLAAKRDCGDLGGHLLKIDDQAEQSYFYKQIWNLWHSRFWIGLNDPRGNGTWKWESDSSSPQYTNWNAGEPNGIGTERCVEMFGGRLAGLWNDHYCYTYRKYICEKEESECTIIIIIICSSFFVVCSSYCANIHTYMINI
ncbi:Hypothetical predicted protein, partial [Paramuricea clavata]